jgi:hypothetical protein
VVIAMQKFSQFVLFRPSVYSSLGEGKRDKLREGTHGLQLYPSVPDNCWPACLGTLQVGRIFEMSNPLQNVPRLFSSSTFQYNVTGECVDVVGGVVS